MEGCREDTRTEVLVPDGVQVHCPGIMTPFLVVVVMYTLTLLILLITINIFLVKKVRIQMFLGAQ